MNAKPSCQFSPPRAPLHPWQWPTRPWVRLHINYAGPICGKMILIVVDVHSKWIETIPVHSATSTATVEKLRTLFAQFGLPESICSDNAKYFTSSEFELFLKQNGIRHPKSSAYHLASIGLAEQVVQLVKQGLRKVKDGTLESRIVRVLFSYRTIPHSTMGQTRAELLTGRLPRTHLDLLFPNISLQVEHKQSQQKRNHDRTSRDRHFRVGDTVQVRNFLQKTPGLGGKNVNTAGPVSFSIQLEDGCCIKRHQDHIRLRLVKNKTHHKTVRIQKRVRLQRRFQ